MLIFHTLAGDLSALSGTDATIAEHIKKIQEREYVTKLGNYFHPSTLGIALVLGYDEIGFEKSLSKPFLRREVCIIEWIYKSTHYLKFSFQPDIFAAFLQHVPYLFITSYQMEANMKRICEGARTKEDVVREGIEMYRQVYIKASQEVIILQRSLEKFFEHPAVTGNSIDLERLGGVSC